MCLIKDLGLRSNEDHQEDGHLTDSPVAEEKTMENALKLKS